MTPQAALQRLIELRELFYDEMMSVMRQIMTGEMTPAQIAGIMIGLRVKKESVSEIAAAAQVMRELSTPVPVTDDRHLVDTCGTGGDAAQTFNISTCAAFVTAAAGARVAKHGGRAVSSKCGSADVLEAFGANINMSPAAVGACIDRIGVGFMFAPNFHLAMKHAAPVRRELGVRTLFNILGPLTNPAGAQRQLMGVFHRDLVGIQARVLQQLGSTHVMTVCAEDGMDELSLSGATLVGELKNGEVREYVVQPSDFGLDRAALDDLRAEDLDTAKQLFLAALSDVPSPACDIVALNAGAAIYVAGVAASHREGVAKAQAVIASGAARRKFGEFLHMSQLAAAGTH